ncbi:hypothetical protein Tco_1236814 [Tanacetum coccineum]
MSNNSEIDSEISLSVFYVRSSDEENTPANDSFSKVDGFHVVPPPITGNFLTPRADISFAGLDEYAIRKKIIESKTTDLNTKTSETVDDEELFEVQTVSPVKTNETQTMAEQDIPPPTITAMKIPIIRKGEYDIWSMRMRQYICHTDHNLWDVIINGDLDRRPFYAPTGETSAPPAPKTAKQLAAKRNHERVKNILLLAIPDEYLLKFYNVADAKSLW